MLVCGCTSKEQSFRDRNLEWDVWVDIVECFHDNGFDLAGVLPTIKIIDYPCGEPNEVQIEDFVFVVHAKTCNPTHIDIRQEYYYNNDATINVTLLRHEYKHAYLWQATGMIGMHDSIWYSESSPCPDEVE